MVCLDKWRQIGIERRKCLSACPFILHNSQEIYHLVTQHRKVFCRSRSDLSLNTAKSFLNQLF